MSEISAKRSKMESQALAGHLSRLSLRLTIPLACLIIFMSDYICRSFNFDQIGALIILALSIPLFLPLVIYRGLAQGRIDLPKMVGSFQLEWIIRLAGCLLLWQAGLGFGGIAFALVLSVFFGLIFTMSREEFYALLAPTQGVKSLLALKISLPYAAIFLAQILALDGDIFIGKMMMSPDNASIAAAMLLFQRIFFFAFLSFASVLQPFVARQDTSQKQSRHALIKVLGVMSAITALSILVISINPDFFAGLLLGEQYKNLGSLLSVAAIIGFCFMTAQLIIVYRIARGYVFAPIWLLGLVGLQYFICITGSNLGADFSYETFLKLKACVIASGAIAFTVITLKPKESECR